MSFAIINFYGHQYLVKPGQKMSVVGPKFEKGATVTVNEVLLTGGGKTEVGDPYLKTPVTLKYDSEGLTEKIKVFTFKSKSRYRKAKGFRAVETVFTVAGIGDTKAAPVKSVSSLKTPAKA